MSKPLETHGSGTEEAELANRQLFERFLGDVAAHNDKVRPDDPDAPTVSEICRLTADGRTSACMLLFRAIGEWNFPETAAARARSGEPCYKHGRG